MKPIIIRFAKILVGLVALCAFGVGIVYLVDRYDQYRIEEAEAEANRAHWANELQKWRPLAEKGDPDAQFALARMHEAGNGVPQSYEEAVNWYRLSAERGHVDAQYALGFAYRFGIDAPLNYNEAGKWFRIVAETPRHSTRMSSQNTIALAQRRLGEIYAEGLGVSQDLVQAYFWFELSKGVEENYLLFDLNKSAKELYIDEILFPRDPRDTIRPAMTPDQIEEALQLARQWQETHK